MSTSMFNAPTPFCFKNKKAASAAESALIQKFDGINAYATERTLFVFEHKSILFRSAVEDFIKSLGGRRHTD